MSSGWDGCLIAAGRLSGGCVAVVPDRQGASKVIDRDEDEETVREAPEGAYRLLDGQQRLNALYTMLTASDEKHRKYGRFYLDLTVARQPPSPAGAGRRGPAMPYLVWREGPDGPLGGGVRRVRRSWALPGPVAALPLGRGRGRDGSW